VIAWGYLGGHDLLTAAVVLTAPASAGLYGVMNGLHGVGMVDTSKAPDSLGQGNAPGPAGAGGVSPPTTNRGDETPIDYLSFTSHEGNLFLKLQKLVDILGLGETADTWFRKSGFNPRGYRELYFGPYGSALKSDSCTGDHENFEVKGVFFSAFDCESIAKLLHWLVLCGTRYGVPRIDIKQDYCPFTPSQIYRAIKKDQVRTRLDRDSLALYESKTGKTVYLGSPSGTYIRCYDYRGHTRLEVQQRSDKAIAWLNEFLMAGPSQWNALAIGLIRDVIDFVEQSERPDRAPLLPWWGKFIEGNERLKTKAPAQMLQPFPFEAFRERVLGYCAPMVRMLSEITGEDIEQIIYTRPYNDRQRDKYHDVNKALLEAERWWRERGKPISPYRAKSFL